MSDVVMHQVPGTRLKAGIKDGILYLEHNQGRAIMLVRDAQALMRWMEDVLPPPPIVAKPEDRW